MTIENLKPGTIARHIAVDTVSLTMGEYITVYLIGAHGTVQVECNVDHDAVPRVCLKREHLGVVSTFEDVYDRHVDPTCPRCMDGDECKEHGA